MIMTFKPFSEILEFPCFSMLLKLELLLPQIILLSSNIFFCVCAIVILKGHVISMMAFQ